MLTGILSNVLLREVPEHLLAGVSSGQFKVYGSIIRSMSNGRIIGHLQETSGLSRLASASGMLPLPGPGLVVDVIGHGVSYSQNEQIKAAVSVVQQLGLANLAVAATGVGVSVAGFAILSAKIGRLETKVEAITDTLRAIARGVEGLRRDRIADDFSRLRTVCEQMDEAWALSDGHSQWQQVASEAHGLVNSFERRAFELLSDPGSDPLAAEPFIEALALAGSTRVSARLATGDDAPARQAAEDTTRKLSELVSRIDVADAAFSRVTAGKWSAATEEWTQALTSATAECETGIANLRDRQIAAASAANTLAELQARDIRGRDWLQIARGEEGSPFICLLSDHAK